MAKDKNAVHFGRVSFGGYKPEEVDEYIAALQVELEGQRAHVAELTEKLRYLVRVVEDMQKNGTAPVVAPAKIDDGAEKAAKLLDEIRGKLSETAESVAALLGAELAAYAEIAEKLAVEKTAPATVEPSPAENAKDAEPCEPESAADEPAQTAANSAESLSFDTMNFESLRKDIDDLAAEKYIPGQEDPTIVAEDLQSIISRTPAKSDAMRTEPETDADVAEAEPERVAAEPENVQPEAETQADTDVAEEQPVKVEAEPEKVEPEQKPAAEDPDDADDGIHFSLFRRR